MINATPTFAIKAKPHLPIHQLSTSHLAIMLYKTNRQTVKTALLQRRSRQPSTLPHAWQLARSTTTTSLHSLLTSTGCTYLSASCTSCAYWSTSANTGPHRATWRMPSSRSRVRNHGIACALRHRPISSCWRCDIQQWVTVPSLLQHRVPGTVCWTQSVAAHC